MSFVTVAWSLVGVIAGVLFCHGPDGASTLVYFGTKTCHWILHLCRYGNKHGVGVVCSIIVAVVAGFHAERVAGATAHFNPSARAAGMTLLACGWWSEVWSLVSLSQAFQTRNKRLGARDDQLLCMVGYPNATQLWVGFLMCIIYGQLLFFYGLMFFGDVLCYHQDKVLQRPVATMRYIEWSFTVPTLMWLVGRLLLNREVEEVLTPILQTLSYIWLAWTGQVVEWMPLRVLLISSCFTIYAESALGQIRWVCKGKPCETGLVIFQCVVFSVYGMVYLGALADLCEPATEEAIYTTMDLSVKISHSVVLSAMHRSAEVDTFFNSVRNYLDILVGLRGLVGAQFDFVINCEVSPMGLVITSTNMMLEHSIGKPLVGRPLEDICCHEEDKVRLKQRALGQQTRPRGRGTSFWERQEALSQVADLIRIDIAWSESPTKSIPAEIFVALSTSEGRIGDAVLIGVKVCVQDGPPSKMPTDEFSEMESEYSDEPARMIPKSKVGSALTFASSNVNYVRNAAKIEQAILATFAEQPEPAASVAPPQMQDPQLPKRSPAPKQATPPPLRENRTSPAPLKPQTSLPSDAPSGPAARTQSGSADASRLAAGPTPQTAQPETVHPPPVASPSKSKEAEVSVCTSKITAQLLSDQNRILEEKAATLGQKRPSNIGDVNRSRRAASVRSFDQRSVCSAPLSPVVEEACGESGTSEGSSRREVHQADLRMMSNRATDLMKTISSHGWSNSGAGATKSPASSCESMLNNVSSSCSEGDQLAALRNELSEGKGRLFSGAISESGQSDACTLKTYRTTLGDCKNVQATVPFLSGNGHLDALNFTIPSSCAKYQQEVEAANTMWDWDKLVVDESELTILHDLGHGSFGTVVKVKWKEGFYALKKFNSQAWTTRRRGFPYAVRREISILAYLASLAHPHLCRLIGIVIQPKIALLFEMCDGGTLFDVLCELITPLRWSQRYEALGQITEALIHLHENQVVHRDLKSNNVLFAQQMNLESTVHVKLTDVGLARWLDGTGEDNGAAHIVKMTPLPSADWYAPECETGFYGSPVDIYGFGVIFLETAVWAPKLPNEWRKQLASLSDTSPIASCIASCLVGPEDRPSAAELLNRVGEMTDAEGDQFVQAWEEVPCES